MPRRLLVPLLMLCAALAGVVLGQRYFSPPAFSAPDLSARDKGPVALTSGTALAPTRALPDFSLVNHTGEPAGPADLTGRWTFLFFGFTQCPEACPMTLAMLRSVREALATELQDPLVPAVLLVSVDPERDTPEVMRDYLAGFDVSFTGLTGAPDEVRAFATALGVPYQKVPMGDGYMIDHSTAILLLDPDGRLAAVFTAPQQAVALQADYRALVGSRAP